MQTISEKLPMVLVAFLVGVGIASFVPTDIFAIDAVLLIACALLLLTLVIPLRFGVIGALVCAGIALGMFRYAVWDERIPDPTLTALIGTDASFIGVVDDEPDVREEHTRLVVRVEHAEVDGATTTVFGRALVVVDRYPEYEYGDRVLLRGALMLPRVFLDQRGHLVHYPMYLKTKGIDFEMHRPWSILLERGDGSSIREVLLSVKHAFLEQINRILPEPESALAGGILLGGKHTLGEEWYERFRLIGIVHILVLSGYNMTIIAEWMGKSALLLGFRGGAMFAGGGVLLFTFMVGASPTVVRAAIMALLVLFARLNGRVSDGLRALLIAGALMVAHDPGILTYDPSFQLSFLASLGLISLAPIIESRTTLLARFPRLRDAVVSTIATQVLVLPLLLYQMGLFSLVALPANLLVLPVVPAAMLCSFVAGLVGFLGDIPAIIGGFPAHLLLAYILFVGKWGAAIPFAAITIPSFPGWIVVVCYVVIGVFLYLRRDQVNSLGERNRISSSV